MKGQATSKESTYMLRAQLKIKPLHEAGQRSSLLNTSGKQHSLSQPLQLTDPKDAEVRGVPSELVRYEVPISKHQSEKRIWLLTRYLYEAHTHTQAQRQRLDLQKTSRANL